MEGDQRIVWIEDIPMATLKGSPWPFIVVERPFLGH
jgi:hypothetical protein